MSLKCLLSTIERQCLNQGGGREDGRKGGWEEGRKGGREEGRKGGREGGVKNVLARKACKK